MPPFAPIRIAVNLRQYYKGKIGGMENYVRNILAALSHHALTIWVHEEEVENVRAMSFEVQEIAQGGQRIELVVSAALREEHVQRLRMPSK